MTEDIITETPDPSSEFAMPLSAKFVKTVIEQFAQPPIGGDDSWQQCSIGIAEDSVVATDSNSAIIVGKTAASHDATLRKEALIECERAKQYDDPVRMFDIPKNIGPGGEVKRMPDVQGVIMTRIAAMKLVATFDPVALLSIAKTAIAAGAFTVDLLQPVDTAKVDALGFRFEFAPNDNHINLFHPFEGLISAKGVFKARAVQRVEDEDVELPEAQEGATKAVSNRESRRVTLTVDSGLQSEEGNSAGSEAVVDTFDYELVRMADHYTLPPVTTLRAADVVASDDEDLGVKILATFNSFNIGGRIVGKQRGPTITQYQIETPPSVKMARVSQLVPNLNMELGIEGSVRIEAPIPGMKAVGVEVPNRVASTVSLRDLIARNAFYEAGALVVGLGQDISGRYIYGDLAAMPHLLVAGATGSGKSIGLSAIITSLIMKNSPRDLRLVMIDPKRVELTLFDRIPHLMCPVVTETNEAPGVLRAIWREMDHRYERLQEAGVRNIASYNAKAASQQDRMPYIVVVIDELADLMLSARAEIETTIVKITQLARATGIHLVVATQRPSVDIITGVIKANVPSRLAYSVASNVDSRVILDVGGAEALLGKGDALWSPIGQAKPTRIQGAYVSEAEIDAVCRFWREQEEPAYSIVIGEEAEKEETSDQSDSSDDPLLADIAYFGLERGQLSTSMIQRKFSIGYQRASSVMVRLEELGVVSPRDGAKPREFLLALVDLTKVMKRVKR